MSACMRERRVNERVKESFWRYKASDKGRDVRERNRENREWNKSAVFVDITHSYPSCVHCVLCGGVVVYLKLTII